MVAVASLALGKSNIKIYVYEPEGDCGYVAIAIEGSKILGVGQSSVSIPEAVGKCFNCDYE